jgi:ATP-binding cassette subfamily B protein
MRYMQHLIKQLKKYGNLAPYVWLDDRTIRRQLWGLLLVMISSIVLNVSTPLLLKSIINHIVDPHATLSYAIQMLLCLYGSWWTLSHIVSSLRSMLAMKLLERSSRVLSTHIFDQLHTLSVRFHMDRSTGAVMSSIERALSGLEAIFFGAILFIVPTVIEIVIAAAVITYFYGFFYSGALIVILVTYVALTTILMKYSAKHYTAYNQKRSQTRSWITDSLLNAETVKYFCNERFEHEHCTNLLQEQEQAGLARGKTDFLIGLCQALVIGCGLIFLTVLSGNAVLAGRMGISDFMLINGYLLQFVSPLQHFGYILHRMKKDLHDMHDVIELIHIKPEIQDSPTATDQAIDAATITFDNVSFGYTKERQILNGISFTVPTGNTVAIVGSTGAGKSTITRLLFRFYDATSGRILINGIDIRDRTQQSLHQAIGVVPQDTILFNTTLYYNIAYGRPTATQQEVEQAIRRAQLHEFIQKLPEGLATIVGERGLKLSGGEKQRVALARVILKNPPIYIFDEATSSLDSHTEREILNNLKEISRGATTIIIAHRLSTVIHADEIIVLENGVIVERGSHQILLNNAGVYAHLWDKQTDK